MRRCYFAVLMGLVSLAGTDATHAHNAMAPPPASELLRGAGGDQPVRTRTAPPKRPRRWPRAFLAAGFAEQDVTFLAPDDPSDQG